ncbi:MAG TPA: PEPxxWA-CTERM sorting domain-containing protein [Sphingomonas sp.]|nr:PEPxxWA-CTERM sorting domain-containing protein [Sphingomonas sp.]
MKKYILGAIAALGLAAPASAAVLTLQGITPSGPNDFTYSYQATLGPDEGVRNGNRFVIFDFAGYIGGSIFSNSPNFALNVENSSPSALVTPGFNDDPSIPNLVFTYTGPDFRNTGGPFSSFDFPSIGAHSTFSGTVIDAFFATTTKNNPVGEANRLLFTLGSISVPRSPVPEPSTWAMLLGGFGLIGLSTRRRGRMVRVAA